MSIIDLEITIENIQTELDLAIQAIQSKGPDSKQMLDISMKFRQVGCGLLLAEYNTDDYYLNLYYSANVYEQMLDIAQKKVKLDPYYLCKSRAKPFFDALATGDMALASRLSKKMTIEFQAHMEIEENYLYYSVIEILITNPSDTGQLESILSAFKNLVQGGDTIRFDALRSLVDRDAESFDEAISEMIIDREDKIQQMVASGRLNPTFGLTDANVFIEGIALLRIARELGIETRRFYQYIPESTLENHIIRPESFSVLQ